MGAPPAVAAIPLLLEDEFEDEETSAQENMLEGNGRIKRKNTDFIIGLKLIALAAGLCLFGLYVALILLETSVSDANDVSCIWMLYIAWIAFVFWFVSGGFGPKRKAH